MKKSSLIILTAASLSLLITASPALARDKDKKERRERIEDRRDDLREFRDDRRDDRNDRREDYRENRREYYDDRYNYRPNYSYRTRYPRRVVVYENRSYGYNYYDLQLALRRVGYYRGPIDGIWGPGSRAALVRYQSSRGWRRDGNVDGRLVVHFGLNY